MELATGKWKLALDSSIPALHVGVFICLSKETQGLI